MTDKSLSNFVFKKCNANLHWVTRRPFVASVSLVTLYSHFATAPAGERLRSIVMSTVCVSVCLSARISPEPRGRSLPIFVRVAYGRGSILLRHVDDGPHRLSAGAGWRQCIARAKCNLRLPCSVFVLLIMLFSGNYTFYRCHMLYACNW